MLNWTLISTSAGWVRSSFCDGAGVSCYTCLFVIFYFMTKYCQFPLDYVVNAYVSAGGL